MSVMVEFYPTVAEFRRIVDERICISTPRELRTYECDGLLGYCVRPRLVVLHASTEEVAACVRLARRFEIPNGTAEQWSSGFI